MKLRAFTAEETDELLQKFKDIADYAYSINEAAYTIMMKKYMAYASNFKPSLFHWSSKSFNYFVSRLNSEDHTRFVDWKYEEGHENFFRKELFRKDGKFLRSVHFYDCYTYYMNKYGQQTLSDEEKNILCDAASVSDYTIFGYNIHEKYRNLVKYAHRPFEFDESDIGWIETVEFYHEKALKWKSNLPKN